MSSGRWGQSRDAAFAPKLSCEWLLNGKLKDKELILGSGFSELTQGVFTEGEVRKLVVRGVLLQRVIPMRDLSSSEAVPCCYLRAVVHHRRVVIGKTQVSGVLKFPEV